MPQPRGISDSDGPTATSALIRLALWGLAVGLAAGAVVSVFRICADHAYHWMRGWAGTDDVATWLPIMGLALVGALTVGFLIRNPAISYGGAHWIHRSMAEGQRHVWRLILVPKFIGSFLVKACGVSVGMEGPSIQLGCATALGLRRFSQAQAAERRHFVLGGCACGLAAAFAAPFGGIPYVYEMMHEKLDRQLMLFMLTGAIGVYVSCTAVFGLGPIVPAPDAMPGLLQCWKMAPLVLLASVLGLLYAWLLHFSAGVTTDQAIIRRQWLPVISFGASGAMLFLFPAITGEGPEIFSSLGSATVGFLALYIVAKLLFTAFCYATPVPCGVMVPLLTLGGICGAWYGYLLAGVGWLDPIYIGACVVLGMGAAFGAAERAPLTALLLVTGMTGAWEASPGILVAAGVGAMLARLVNSKPI